MREPIVKNILAVRNDRFGEFLLIIPALRALKQKYPLAKITLVVSPYVRELAGYIEYADQILCWELKKHSLAEAFRFAHGLRNKFELAVIFNPSKEAHLISFLAGIKKRVGYNRKWGLLLNLKKEDRKHLEDKHEVEYNLDLVRLTGADTHDLSLSLKELPEQNIRMYRGAIVIHPYTSDPVKEWPLENFRLLTLKLADELQAKVVIVGKQAEGVHQPYFSGLSPNVIDMSDKTSLIELGALLKESKLLISVDSGPVHLAACFGVPIVVLFRNDIPGKGPKRWGPWGKGNTVIEKTSLSDITVEEVFLKVKEAL